jgi:hypothetical protein
MTRGVEQRCSGHLKRILQRWITFGLLFPNLLQSRDMIIRVATHVTDSDCNPIPHTNYAQLRDRVLLEELVYESHGVDNHQQVSRRPEVFLIHGKGHIENNDEVPNDTSLQWRGIFQQSDRTISNCLLYSETRNSLPLSLACLK